MGLVDGEQGDAAAVEQRKEPVGEQALGSDVEQVQGPVQQPAFGLGGLVGGERGIQAGRAHSELAEGIHLVLHQRDEWRDHDRGPGSEQGGQLVAERLAAAGGHQHQGIPAGRKMADDGCLFAAEGVESENFAQEATGLDIPWAGPGSRRFVS
jgi:hypothetical protein